MKSENNKNLLYDYVHGLLSDNERVAFEKQLALSVELQNDLKRVQQYYSLVKSSEQSAVPRDFIANVHRKAGIQSELPDNIVSQVPSVGINYGNISDQVNLQKEYNDNNSLKSRLKRWFPFELAGVLATVVILVFIFIPNVDMPKSSKNVAFNDALLQESDENSIAANKQMLQDNVSTASDIVAPEPAMSIDKKRSLNKTAPVKVREKKSDLPGQSNIHNKVKGISADKQVLPQKTAPASPATSGSSVTSAVNKEAGKRAAPAMYTDKPALEILNKDAADMSGTISEQTVASIPIRIILRTSEAVSSDMNHTAPSSIPQENKKIQTRQTQRIRATGSESELSKSENIAGNAASSSEVVIGTIDKTEIETLFSGYYIAWEQLQVDDKKLLYRLNGSGLSVKTVVDKLKSTGFIQENSPEFTDDAVQIDLEIYY